MAVTALQSVTKASTPSAADRTAQSLSTDDFFKILIAELSNQNPLEPMDNQKLLDQISSINNVASTRSLVDTLKSLTSTQGLGSASSLIGKKVAGVINNKPVSGLVEKALVEDGQIFLQVAGQKLPLSGVQEVTS